MEGEDASVVRVHAFKCGRASGCGFVELLVYFLGGVRDVVEEPWHSESVPEPRHQCARVESGLA